MKRIKSVTYLLIAIVISQSCNKYLEAPPDKKLIIPSKISDLQSILDNATKMNRNMTMVGEYSTDNVYVTDEDYHKMITGSQNLYSWGKEIIYDGWPNAWGGSYDIVYYANVVLSKINDLPKNEEFDLSNVKGSALFYRSFAFANLVFAWAKAFDSTATKADMGIPLRLSDDFNIPSTRSSLMQTYQQIIDDLKTAISLLPDHPLHVMRPSKPAAYALLARVYLSMRNYDESLEMALKALIYNSSLLNYNAEDINAKYPFEMYNTETIFYSQMYGSAGLGPKQVKMDSTLLSHYNSNDLRKIAFYQENLGASIGTFTFKGNYTGGGTIFNGLATDELYLIAAECYCRKGKNTDAKAELSILLKNRYKTGTFTSDYPKDQSKLLNYILLERRKELVFRDLRWIDIKRLNKEGKEITIKRKINGEIYDLPPNDNKFALPIPEYIIEKTGMAQNPR